MARRGERRWIPRALGLLVSLAIPWRGTAATPASLPDAAAVRAGDYLWFEEHIAPYLRAPSLEHPGSGPGTAAPAPDQPLPARAIGLRERALDPLNPALAPGGPPDAPGEWSGLLQPGLFSSGL